MTELVRVPSVELLREIADALHLFLYQDISRAGATWVQEDDFLPAFTRLADALRAVRPLIDKPQGWPNRMVRALPAALDGFDRVASTWGWERLAEPEPARSTFIEERLNRFREERERPMYESALSWQAGCRGLDDCPPDVDAMAEEGRDRGFSPTLTPEEGKARFWDACSAWRKAPRLGRRYPKLEIEERQHLADVTNALQGGLGQVEAKSRAEAAKAASPAVVPTPEGKRHSEDPAIKKTKTKAKHFKRGELGDKALQLLSLEPGMSNEEIAERLGCHPKSLSSPKLIKFQVLREEIKRRKEEFREPFRGVRNLPRRRGRDDDQSS